MLIDSYQNKLSFQIQEMMDYLSLKEVEVPHYNQPWPKSLATEYQIDESEKRGKFFIDQKCSLSYRGEVFDFRWVAVGNSENKSVPYNHTPTLVPVKLFRLTPKVFMLERVKEILAAQCTGRLVSTSFRSQMPFIMSLLLKATQLDFLLTDSI